MKACEGSGSLNPFLTSALHGGELLASRPGHSTPSERPSLSIVQATGWAPASVWTFRRKVSFPHRDQKSESCSLQLSYYNDPPDCSGWDGVYFSGEISDCTSIIREASSAGLNSVLRMTVKHSEFSGDVSSIYFCHAAVKTVEWSPAIMTFSDYNHAP